MFETPLQHAEDNKREMMVLEKKRHVVCVPVRVPLGASPSAPVVSRLGLGLHYDPPPPFPRDRRSALP